MGNGYCKKSKDVYVAKVPKELLTNKKFTKDTKKDKHGLVVMSYNDKKYSRETTGEIEGYEEYYIRFAYELIKTNLELINKVAPFTASRMVNLQYYYLYSELDNSTVLIDKSDIYVTMIYVYRILKLKNIVDNTVGIIYIEDNDKIKNIKYAFYKNKNVNYKYSCSEERLIEVLDKICEKKEKEGMEEMEEVKYESKKDGYVLLESKKNV